MKILFLDILSDFPAKYSKTLKVAVHEFRHFQINYFYTQDVLIGIL